MADVTKKASIFDHAVEDRFGKQVSMRETFEGKGKKAFLVVNVASACGLTSSNYKGLTELYGELSAKGLEIVAFPCNDFGSQEKGSNEEVCAFAAKRGATWATMGKIAVEQGDQSHPLFKFLKSALPGELWGLLGRSVKWNFSKWLCD